MGPWKLPAEVAAWLNHLSQPLHRRHAWRLLPLVVGLLFAQGRRIIAPRLSCKKEARLPSGGPLYQGRFSSFPVETSRHRFTVLRLVERNTWGAHRVGRAEGGRWAA